MGLEKYFPDGVPSELQDMYSYLQGTRSVPSIKTVGYLDNPNGYGAYKSTDNSIKVLGGMDSAKYQNTVAHELQHAAFNRIGKDYLYASALQGSPNYTQLDDQLLQGRRKLMEPSKLDPRLPTDTPSEEDWYKYRWGDKDEALAHGLANSVLPRGRMNPIGGHVDATKAQEAMILLDLAKRQAMQTRQTPKSFLGSLFGQ